jgi:hypothetical protein
MSQPPLPGLRERRGRLGLGKDHRPDLPQVVIGLAVTREGIPVRVWTWPGNTSDQTVIEQVKADLGGWKLGRCVWVVDSGFSSAENLRSLRRAGGHYIAGMKLRAGTAEAKLRQRVGVLDQRVAQWDNQPAPADFDRDGVNLLRRQGHGSTPGPGTPAGRARRRR